MQDEIYPRHYEGWKNCITQKCKIPLTEDYIKERIAALSNNDSKERSTFVEKYGEHWTSTVLNYFKQAMGEVQKNKGKPIP